MATYTQDGVMVEDEPTADPNIRRVKVPHGMAMPEYVTARTTGDQYDLWYYPTQMAYLMNRFVSNYSAAADSIIDTANNAVDNIGDALESAGALGKWVVMGLVAIAVLEGLKRTK